MKAFYATAEKVLQIKCGNPVVRSFIKEKQLISERDQVDEAIAQYFQTVYQGDDQQADSEEDLALWERLQAATEATQGMFTA